jgi:hypothetical protein
MFKKRLFWSKKLLLDIDEGRNALTDDFLFRFEFLVSFRNL